MLSYDFVYYETVSVVYNTHVVILQFTFDT